MDERRGFAERVWYGGDALASTIARRAARPPSACFGGVVGARDILYDAGWLPARETRDPAVSVGNLTVGGTGKTPIAAWIARGLAARGARPAVVLRGYGDDEPLVHRALNPDVPVVIGRRSRRRGRAGGGSGRDVAVLDDAFQHRRVQRLATWCWSAPTGGRATCGCCRRGRGASRSSRCVARRSSIVTRKAASDRASARCTSSWLGSRRRSRAYRSDSTSGDLVAADGSGVRRGRSTTSAGRDGSRDCCRSRIPAFVQQMRAIGRDGRRADLSRSPLVHAADIAERRAGLTPSDLVICTLKDAVKLAPLWPRLAPPLWYVSQHVMVERGVGGLERCSTTSCACVPEPSRTAG